MKTKNLLRAGHVWFLPTLSTLAERLDLRDRKTKRKTTGTRVTKTQVTKSFASVALYALSGWAMKGSPLGGWVSGESASLEQFRHAEAGGLTVLATP